jgi:transposase
MDAKTSETSIRFALHSETKARVRWAHQKARRRFANLDREPLPPNAPDASPVEASARQLR